MDARRIHFIVRWERSIAAETACCKRGSSAILWAWMGLQSQYDLEVAEGWLADSLDTIAVHTEVFLASAVVSQ